MPEHRRRFSPQFRAEAVQMVIETGKPIAQVARDLGIHDGTLGNWVNAWRHEPEALGRESGEPPCIAGWLIETLPSPCQSATRESHSPGPWLR